MGVNYQTFASWVQKRRRARQQCPPATKALPATPATPAATGAIRLLEAVVERGDDQTALVNHAESLCVHLLGGARLEGRDARQARLAAELLKAFLPARPG